MDNKSFEIPEICSTVTMKVFSDCSGGNSSPSYPADAGGCIFFALRRQALCSRTRNERGPSQGGIASSRSAVLEVHDRPYPALT